MSSAPTERFGTCWAWCLLETEGKPLTGVFLRTFAMSFDQFLVKLDGAATIELAVDKRWFPYSVQPLSILPRRKTGGSILLLTEITGQREAAGNLEIQ